VSKLAIQRCNLVVVGAWNPAIIAPDWIKHEFPDLIRGTEYEVSYNPTTTPRIRFIMDGVQIDPNDGRLRLRPHTADVSRLELIPRLAAAICTRLPHTPTRAVGNNFIYESEGDEHLEVLDFLNPQQQDQFYQKLDLGKVARTQIRHSFSFPTHQLNLIYNARQDGESIVFNFHYQATHSARVVEAINAFQENFRYTENLVNRILIKNKT
jgi:hypothetical protein